MPEVLYHFSSGMTMEKTENALSAIPAALKSESQSGRGLPHSKTCRQHEPLWKTRQRLGVRAVLCRFFFGLTMVKIDNALSAIPTGLKSESQSGRGLPHSKT